MPKIRIWKLGDLNRMILPSKEEVDEFEKTLKDWDGKSSLDIIWGPTLNVIELDVSEGDVHVVVRQGQ